MCLSLGLSLFHLWHLSFRLRKAQATLALHGFIRRNSCESFLQFLPWHFASIWSCTCILFSAIFVVFLTSFHTVFFYCGTCFFTYNIPHPHIKHVVPNATHTLYHFEYANICAFAIGYKDCKISLCPDIGTSFLPWAGLVKNYLEVEITSVLEVASGAYQG